MKKGDVLAVAQIAGIMAAKRTPDIIPLCHPVALSSVKVELVCDKAKSAVHIAATCKVTGQTGVEMEALAAVAAAALTVYDMCKAADRAMRIGDIRLVKKSGGKSGRLPAGLISRYAAQSCRSPHEIQRTIIPGPGGLIPLPHPST